MWNICRKHCKYFGHFIEKIFLWRYGCQFCASYILKKELYKVFIHPMAAVCICRGRSYMKCYFCL